MGPLVFVALGIAFVLGFFLRRRIPRRLAGRLTLISITGAVMAIAAYIGMIGAVGESSFVLRRYLWIVIGTVFLVCLCLLPVGLFAFFGSAGTQNDDRAGRDP